MANPNDPLFEIDSKQILAKLHLAALSQVTQGFVINTGVKNPQDKGNPLNPGNTEFDLTNKSGEYQLGIGRSDFSYLVPFSLEEDKLYKKLLDTLLKLKKNEKADPKELFEAKLSLLKYVVEKYAFSDGNDTEEVKEFKKISSEALKEKFEEKKLLDKDADKENDKKDEKTSQLDAALNQLPTAYTAETTYRNEQKTKAIKDWTKSTFEQLKIYFTTFAGKDAASKIKLTDVAGFPLDIDGKTNSQKSAEKQIKNFKLTPVDEKTLKTAESAHVLKEPNKPFTTTLCFVLGYNLEVETM